MFKSKIYPKLKIRKSLLVIISVLVKCCIYSKFLIKAKRKTLERQINFDLSEVDNTVSN